MSCNDSVLVELFSEFILKWFKIRERASKPGMLLKYLNTIIYYTNIVLEFLYLK